MLIKYLDLSSPFHDRMAELGTHKPPPLAFYHWLSLPDTLSWNLWSLHFPGDWLNSQLCLLVHTAKTTAVTGFLKKAEWRPGQIQAPIKRTTPAKRKNHIPRVPGGGGEGRKPKLPIRTPFQKSHIMASQAPWCDKEMTVSGERIESSSGSAGWRMRQPFFPRQVEFNSLNRNIDSSVSRVMTLTWWILGPCQKPVSIQRVFNWKMAGKQGSRSLLEPGVHTSIWSVSVPAANTREH